jgi:hypothetical protein
MQSSFQQNYCSGTHRFGGVDLLPLEPVEIEPPEQDPTVIRLFFAGH